MARINIDDELHAERGFKNLVRALGDEDKAIGMLYRFWRQAQDYWGKECQLMPLEEFQDDGFGPILEAKLARMKPEGVEAVGGEDRFAWYLQKCRASKAAVKARVGDRKPNPGVPGNNSGGPGSSSGHHNDEPEFNFQSTGDSSANNPTAPAPSSAPVTAPSSVTSSAPAPASAPVPTADDVRECMVEWQRTLDHFGINRKADLGDQTVIARVILDHNKLGRDGVEWVKNAFQGARKQPTSKRFNPKDFVSLSIYLHKDRIERLVNIGAGRESAEGLDWGGFLGGSK